MTKRDVVKMALDFKKPPYVPWEFGFTQEAMEKLIQHCGKNGLEGLLQNHLLYLGNDIGYVTPVDNGRFRDIFGVVWDRSIDKDIGVVKNCVLPEPTLKDLKLPDPVNPTFFKDIPRAIKENGDCFRMFAIGFSLYERAWTLRGMENLMMDFHDNPGFVHDLLNTIADYNITQFKEAMKYDIDAVKFGDDWGQQRGLQMGPKLWREFIYPVLKRMYGEVKKAGKYVIIHSCGDVDEIFDDLVGIGLNCFNPFQPEVMDTDMLMKKYFGKLAFFGGLSTQKTLPFGTAEDVRCETLHLLEMGSRSGYIFAPAHAVEGDVPLENMLAFIELAKQQKNFRS